jgi:LysM repeat protein
VCTKVLAIGKAVLMLAAAIMAAHLASTGVTPIHRVPSPVTSAVVKPGDTLSALASSHRVALAQILRWNPQVTDANLITIGERIAVALDGPHSPVERLGASSGTGYSLDMYRPPATYSGPSRGTRYVKPKPKPKPKFFDPSGILAPWEVGELWTEAGGPSWAEGEAEDIAYCESSDNTDAYNPSGATGLFQILGAVPGDPSDLWDGYDNARNAVSKFEESGDTFAQWVC